MERLGRIEEVTSDGRAIVSCSAAPGIGDAVFDSRFKMIGTVGRVFGPVDSPYVTVLPAIKDDLNGLLNKETYFRGENKDGKNKGRRGRN